MCESRRQGCYGWRGDGGEERTPRGEQGPEGATQGSLWGRVVSAVERGGGADARICRWIPAPQVWGLRLPRSRPSPRARLTIGPAHGIVERAGDAPPRGTLGGVARVHAPCVLIVAPVQLVLKEISLVIVGPGEGSIDAARREAEVRDGPRVSFLYVIVLKHPVSVSWGREKEPWAGVRPARRARAPALAPPTDGHPDAQCPWRKSQEGSLSACCAPGRGPTRASSLGRRGQMRRPHHSQGARLPAPTPRSHFGQRGLVHFCCEAG